MACECESVDALRRADVHVRGSAAGIRHVTFDVMLHDHLSPTVKSDTLGHSLRSTNNQNQSPNWFWLFVDRKTDNNEKQKTNPRLVLVLVIIGPYGQQITKTFLF